MKRLVLLAIFAAIAPFALATLAHAAPLPMQAAPLRAEVKAKGAKAVVQRLLRSNQFDTMLRRIETGRADWLALAGDLRAEKDATDASATSGLNDAVARALPISPAGVLELVAKGFAVEDLCTLPYIEPTPAVEKRYFARAKAAVKRVKMDALAQAATQCLARLEEVEKMK
jgi:hypothetical protein